MLQTIKHVFTSRCAKEVPYEFHALASYEVDFQAAQKLYAILQEMKTPAVVEIKSRMELINDPVLSVYEFTVEILVTPVESSNVVINRVVVV